MAVQTADPSALNSPAKILKKPGSSQGSNLLAQVCLGVIAFIWMIPLLFALLASLRTRADTVTNGYVSIPKSFTFENYITAYRDVEMAKFFTNTLIILVPSVLIVLALSSMLAFALIRYSWKFNIGLLMLFTAGNLLPQQALIIPLYRMYRWLPLPSFLSETETFLSSYTGIIAIHVAFQLGFCTFVLSNFMKALPKDLNSAAMVDGAGAFRIYWQIILPLTRPALAALATLQVTWIYNDYFWARILEQRPDAKPITSAINVLSGGLLADDNQIMAGCLIAMIPILIVYFALQRHFIGGLALGATKG